MNKVKKNKKFFEEKLKELSKCSRVLDVGGGAPFQKQMAKYEPWFEGVKYQTMDYSPAFKPDIVGDIHNMPFANEELEGILCKAVLEHVLDPIRAVDEIHRVLKKDGKVLLWVPFLYPYHSHSSEYGDYWRFSKDAIKHMFRNFSKLEMVESKGYFKTMMELSPLPHFGQRALSPFADLMDSIVPISNQVSGYTIYAEK